MKKMRIRIKRDGKTEIHVEGATGDACLSFTQALESALGEVEDRELTPDYHAVDELSIELEEEIEESESL